MRRQLRTQMDLFIPADQANELANLDRCKAIALLQALLKEAITVPFADQLNTGSEEPSHE